jgi:ABC-type bacteriocin/lantibiotic exporter with double-glycine peptidase domain
MAALKDPNSPLKRFFKLINLEREDISLLYLYAILAGVINLSLPLGIQAIMGLVVGGQVSSSWFLMIGLVIFGIGFAGGLQIMQLSISERLQQRILAKASFDFAFRVPRMRLESILKQYAPELMNRYFDVMSVQKSISKILVDFSTAFLQIIFGLILLAFYHGYFAFFGILMFFLLIFIFKVSFPNGVRTSLDESTQKYKIGAWLEELARTMGIVKLAGYTDMHMKKTDKLVAAYIRDRKAHFRVLLFQYTNIVAFKTIVTGGLLIIGSLLVIDNQISIGQFVASEIVIILILNSVEKVMASIETIYDILTSLEKIGQITDIEIEGEKGIAFEDIDTGKGVEIVFKEVGYTYPASNRTTLKDINLHIKPGEKICIAGFPGAGRSSLINLAASMLHNYTGTITFNDITLKNLNLISLRSYVGENLAKKEIIHGTIAENIGMGRDDISYHDIKKATDAVGLTAYIQSTEEGFNTIIVPEDITIPTSVVNKITMARSIAEKPHLFILDDFMNSLERKDKEKIVDSITGPDKFWTLLGASNEMAFASKCDRILVMRDGAIVDSGDFELISKRPYFNEIFIILCHMCFMFSNYSLLHSYT